MHMLLDGGYGAAGALDSRPRAVKRGSFQYAWTSLHVHVLQVLDRIAEEIDPEGTGLSYGDFESIASRMPDFINSFKMAV